MARTDGQTDRRTDRRTDGGDHHNIPTFFSKSVGIKTAVNPLHAGKCVSCSNSSAEFQKLAFSSSFFHRILLE